jgi:hypothetical protein
MPEAGSTFTDWQQVERDSLLFVDDDFGWSEPPRRRRMTESAPRARPGATYEPAYDEPVRAQRRTAVLDYEPRVAPQRDDAWDQPTATHSHFDEMMEEWNASFGDGARRESAQRADERAFDLSEPGHPGGAADGSRRTVLITGHGDERYLPAPRQRRNSELRFHERSSFSPDRAGLWAVLLGIALVIGCIAH